VAALEVRRHREGGEARRVVAGLAGAARDERRMVDAARLPARPPSATRAPDPARRGTGDNRMSDRTTTNVG